MAAFLDTDNLKEDLDKFPSTFDLDMTNLTKDRVTSIITKLNDDRENTTKPKAEGIHITNFLSYLYFLLEDHEHAHQHIDESLQKDPDNIIANANRARILLENGEISDVEDVITKLQILKKGDDYEKRKCCAEADLAYAYSRSGPWYHQKAVDLYTRVVKAYPTEYAWQFGLGLTLLRQTHRFNSKSDDRFNSKQKGKTMVHIAELLLTVAERSEDPIISSKAYARLGKAVFDIEKNKYGNLPTELKKLDYKTCYENAETKGPEEPSVLNICGQLARYRGELDTSVTFLRKSLQISPTCQGYHHLALTLKRKVEMGPARGHSVTNTDNSRAQGAKTRNKEYTHSSNGRGRNTNQNSYRREPRGYYHDHNDRSQRGHHRNQQTGHRPYRSSDRYGNDVFDGGWDGYRNVNGAYNYGVDGYDNAGHAYNGGWNVYGNANVGGNGGWYGYSDISNGWGGYGDGRRRKESMGYSHVGRRSIQGGNSRGRGSRGRYNPNRNVQKEEASQYCLTDPAERKKRQNLRQLIKSPLTVKAHPGNKLLIEAIELLEKTEELAHYPLNIQYDKGIMYRMLGQIEKAVEVFKQIVSKRKYLPTETLLTNVYEQLGLCLLELSKSEEISPDVKQKYKKDGQAHLSHAVQLQSKIVANDPQFKEVWNSYSTLKELLSDKSDGKPRQLAVLHMLMGDHGDSINIYKELLLKEKDQMKPDDCIKMLECYTKEGQHDKSVSLLRSWECTTVFAGLPPSLIFDVYINGAFHAHTTDNVQLAYQHFRHAFQVCGMFDKATDQTEVDEDEDTKDILILHSCADSWKCKLPRNLGTILEDCTGLQYTVNTDNVLPNAITSESMVSIMQKMSCIIIMTHGCADKYDKFYVNHALQMGSEKSSPKVLVVSDDKCNVPDIARTKSFILMPPPIEDAMQPSDQIPEEHTKWIKEFISLLKPT